MGAVAIRVRVGDASAGVGGSTPAPATRRAGGGSGGGKGNGGAAGVGKLGSLALSHGTAFCVGSVCTTGTGGGFLRGRPRFGRLDLAASGRICSGTCCLILLFILRSLKKMLNGLCCDDDYTIAQWLEHRWLQAKVPGSSPGGASQFSLQTFPVCLFP